MSKEGKKKSKMSIKERRAVRRAMGIEKQGPGKKDQ